MENQPNQPQQYRETIDILVDLWNTIAKTTPCIASQTIYELLATRQFIHENLADVELIVDDFFLEEIYKKDWKKDQRELVEEIRKTYNHTRNYLAKIDN